MNLFQKKIQETADMKAAIMWADDIVDSCFNGIGAAEVNSRHYRCRYADGHSRSEARERARAQIQEYYDSGYTVNVRNIVIQKVFSFLRPKYRCFITFYYK